MQTLRKLLGLTLLLGTLSATALAGDIETPPIPQPPPATAPDTTGSDGATAGGDIETPPLVLVIAEAGLSAMLSVINGY